jgi:hypothetical protein
MAGLTESNNIHTKHGLLVCMMAVTCCASSGDRIDFKGDVEIFSGYESNIFRNTHDMRFPPSQGGKSYDPVTHDAAGGVALNAKTTVRLNKSNRLTGTIKAEYQAYPRYPNANQGQADGEIEYRYNPGKKLELRIPASTGYIRILGIDIHEYWAFDAVPRIRISPSKRIDFECRYHYSVRDYRTPDTVAALDNAQNEIIIQAEPHFGNNLRHSMGIEAAYLFKRYRQLGSYDSLGILHDTPLRSYHYISLELSYKYNFGFGIFNLAYRPRYRIDPYAGYYSYLENRIATGLSAKLSSLTTMDIDAAWRYRHYLVHTAAQPGTDAEPDLIMHYFELSVNAEQRIGRTIILFAAYDLTLRKTNTRVLYFHTYRDFTDMIWKAGIRFIL